MPDPVTIPPVVFTAGTPAPVEVPKPISDSLSRELDQMRTGVPAGKRGWANLGVSTQGMEAGVGANVLARSWGTLGVGGYAARLWGGGWVAGARAQFVW
jgi:hypothetical protein